MNEYMLYVMIANAVLLLILLFFVYKFRTVLYLLLKYWFLKPRGAKLVLRTRPKEKFAEFDVWVPNSDGMVELKDKDGKKHYIGILPNGVFYNNLIDGHIIMYREGDASNLTIDEKEVKSIVVGSKYITDLALAIEMKKTLDVLRENRWILYAAIAAAIAAAAAAFFAFSNGNTLNQLLNLAQTSLTKISSIKPIITNATLPG